MNPAPGLVSWFHESGFGFRKSCLNKRNGFWNRFQFWSNQTGPQLNWHHSLQGTRQKWTDVSHHVQLSMCTSRDKMAASGMEFSVLIECEFVAVVSWKEGWLCFFFHTKFALVQSDDWWVSFTRPWPVFTRLGRPGEWLVRTLDFRVCN